MTREEVASVMHYCKESGINKLDATARELENQLARLRKKVFGKMSEKQLSLDPARLSLFDRNQLMSEEEKAGLAKSVEESGEGITGMITVKANPSRKPLDITRLAVEVENIYPEGTTDENGIPYVDTFILTHGNQDHCRGLKKYFYQVLPRSLLGRFSACSIPYYLHIHSIFSP